MKQYDPALPVKYERKRGVNQKGINGIESCVKGGSGHLCSFESFTQPNACMNPTDRGFPGSKG